MAGASGEDDIKKLIRLPQGCYGIITPATSEQFGGIYTTGLWPCIPIFIISSTKQTILLSHVDAITDIENKRHGLPGWMDRCLFHEPQITVLYSLTPELREAGFKERIEKIIFDYNSIHSTYQVKCRKMEKHYRTIALLRRGKIIARNINYLDPRIGTGDTGYEDLKDYVNEVSVLCTRSHQRRILEDRGGITIEPVCAFNGTEMLGIVKAKRLHPDISWYLDDTIRSDSEDDSGGEPKVSDLKFTLSSGSSGSGK